MSINLIPQHIPGMGHQGLKYISKRGQRAYGFVVVVGL
jgi:hypothetical protein